MIGTSVIFGVNTVQFSHKVKHPSVTLVYKAEGECCKTLGQ